MVDHINSQVAYATPETGQDKTDPKENAGAKEFAFFGDDGFTFGDFVDAINPLQHIPVVSTAYRAITGDELDPGSRLTGGTLYGGPIGLAASAFNVILEHNTGKDSGEHVLAWFDGDEVAPDDQIMVADNKNTPGQEKAFSPISGFAPVQHIPESEADAFAAGEASLRMAELQEFMNPALSKEVHDTTMPGVNRGAGSAGTWAPPADLAPPPFPTERPGSVTPSDSTSFFRAKEAHSSAVERHAQTLMNQPVTTTPSAEPIAAPPSSPAPAPTQKQGQAEGLDALRAFARDMKAQNQNPGTAPAQPQAHVQQPQALPPSPQAPNTAQLSTTQDNAWFADMMARNMDRYRNDDVGG